MGAKKRGQKLPLFYYSDGGDRESPFKFVAKVRDEQTHPRCHHVVTPLNNPGGPEGDTVTVAEKLLNTEY